LEEEGIIMRIFVALISLTLLLTACGGTTSKNMSYDKNYGYDDDTVLWTNADGTDCDYGDYLEGDSDCFKTKKTKLHKLPSAKIIAKAKVVHTKKISLKQRVKTKIQSTKSKVSASVSKTKKVITKPKINIIKPKTKLSTTYKSKTKSSSFFKSSSSRKSSSSSRSSKRRR
jgi:hypothetical protein